MRCTDVEDKYFMISSRLKPAVVGDVARVDDMLINMPVDYTDETMRLALAYQSSIVADMGGNNILPALQTIYKVPLTGVGWSRQIIFLTDGDVDNQTEVLSLIREHSTDTNFFAIELGASVSTSLIKAVTRAGCGKAVFVKNPENLATVVLDILNCALQDPALGVSLSWQVQSSTSSSPLEVLTIPSYLPPIFYGAYLVVFGLVKNHELVRDDHLILKLRCSQESPNSQMTSSNIRKESINRDTAIFAANEDIRKRCLVASISDQLDIDGKNF
ncbi:unnamed protein product [Schistocephalus solidus]|uniref:VWFA domain-containing protein n=1 Tax=Schistocephalus solidus TaxID=70667 RepID=A0A183SK50_SCHSO|nr:unnamed protein product [Schistocephalus solidus]